jgi:hypothetical protein
LRLDSAEPCNLIFGFPLAADHVSLPRLSLPPAVTYLISPRHCPPLQNAAKCFNPIQIASKPSMQNNAISCKKVLQNASKCFVLLLAHLCIRPRCAAISKRVASCFSPKDELLTCFRISRKCKKMKIHSLLPRARARDRSVAPPVRSAKTDETARPSSFAPQSVRKSIELKLITLHKLGKYKLSIDGF